MQVQAFELEKQKVEFRKAFGCGRLSTLDRQSENPTQFDLVITDQTMPFMAGEDLGKELMRIRPDIPVILCTGYSDLISAEKAMAIGVRGFILKPFTVSEGAQLIRDVLD